MKETKEVIAFQQASMTLNQIYEGGKNLSYDTEDIAPFYDEKASTQVNNFIESNGAKNSVVDQFNPLKYRRYIELLDTFQKEHGNNNALQVVYLASGFSNYAQQALQSNKYKIQFFEIDHHSILDRKEKIARYAEKNFNGQIKYVRTDYLTEGVVKPLQEKGIDLNLPTLFIWQGQVANLKHEEIEKVLKEISEHFNNKIAMGLDYFSEQLVTKTTGLLSVDTLMRNLTTAFGINFITGFNAVSITTLMGKYGFNYGNKIETGNDLAKKYQQLPEASLEHAAIYTGMRPGK